MVDDAQAGSEFFDELAAQYSEIHAKGMSISGEPSGYFAQYKIDRLKALGIPSDATVLDFGCGIGNLTELLVNSFSAVEGYDPSLASVQIARARVPGVTFVSDAADIPPLSFDVVILAGVLHHVPPAERIAVMGQARDALKPGGHLVVFEHNPYNPVTRRVVDTCPFDKDAILLRPAEVRRVLTGAGISDVIQKYIVFFPRPLAFLRGVEPAIGFFPLGAQTMTVGTRQAS